MGSQKKKTKGKLDIWEDKWNLSDGVMKDKMREKIAMKKGRGSIRRETERGRKIWCERRDGKEMSAMKQFILDSKQFTLF